MAEYIEREAVLELIDGIYDCNDMVFEKNDSCVGLDCGSCRWRDTKNYIRGRLSRIPAADVVPVVHGRWVDPHWKSSLHYMNCNQCGGEVQHQVYHGTEKYYRHCPFCGARMDGDGDGV